MSDFSDRVAQMTECPAVLRTLQGRIVERVREIQDIAAFGPHPGLTALDDEPGTLYRGWL